MKVPRPDSINDDPKNAQGMTKHPFGEPYSHGPEHHPDGAVDPDLPGRGTVDFNEPRSPNSVVRHKVKTSGHSRRGTFPAPTD